LRPIIAGDAKSNKTEEKVSGCIKVENYEACKEGRLRIIALLIFFGAAPIIRHFG
jgi:hypothetical protein